jgi:heme-degrading monooxygenase HmoA
LGIILPLLQGNFDLKNRKQFLSDNKSGKGVSITFWDSEEEAIGNEKSGYYQDQVNKFKEYFTAPPVREGYEVSVQA